MTEPLRAIVAERGQVTIPKTLRDKLGIKPGAVLEFTAEKGKLIAAKVLNEDPIARVFGCLGTGLDTDAVMIELRGDADP